MRILPEIEHVLTVIKANKYRVHILISMSHLAGEALHYEPLNIIRDGISALLGGWIGLNAGNKLCSSLLRLQPSL